MPCGTAKSARNRIYTILGVLALIVAPLAGAEPAGEPGRITGKPNPLKNVYFGEQHMHTQNSFDAYTVGVRGTWAEAYEFALGKPSKLSTTGEKMQRKTPYDFVAITDHSEYYGVFKNMADPKSPLSKNPFAKRMASSDPKEVEQAAVDIIATTLSGIPVKAFVDPQLLKSNWQDFIKVADKYNDPGKFTALYAYEWTSIPGGQNMHRNVFFKDKAAAMPFSSFQSEQPEDLWTYLEIQRAQGIDVIAIPHNGNVSNGLMYAPTKMNGDPIDARYARRQMENEPLTEIHQTKGNSEAHPLLSPNDEFANFEPFPNLISLDHPSQVTNGYIRQGLVMGMKLETEVGYNPYKMGIVAGADVHSGYQGNEEWDWKGAHGVADDTPEKRLSPTPNASGEAGYVVSSAGATAVWAEENTREGIFNGMKSKETYGTTGTLIRLRFFGGWGYSKNLVEDEKFVEKAYKGGVPMGQDLPKKASKAPTFAVWALKDPESGNLDRIQIVKGWSNPKTGYPEEKIYDIAWSDNRKIDSKTGKLPAVGNTVDVTKATYTNDIGDTQLSVVWTDPDFDPSMKAVYYARVLEIPTPRWSTYDSARNNLPLPTEVPATIQERAYSSPIWYTPGATKTAMK
jgi:hypothetical protein